MFFRSFDQRNPPLTPAQLHAPSRGRRLAIRACALALGIVTVWGGPRAAIGQTVEGLDQAERSGPGWASDPGSAPREPVPLEETPLGVDEIEALTRRMETIESRIGDPIAATPKPEPQPKPGWDVRLGGHVQLDYVMWANADPAIPDTSNYFNFRRLRLLAEGKGYDHYDFRLQLTLEPDNALDNPSTAILTPQVKDAYFSLNEIPGLGRFRIGNFFVPFGLEQVTNDTNNIFLERSIPTQGIFTPDREVGMALYNHLPDYRVAWATGIFLDSINEGTKKRLDDNQGYRLSGRFTWLPYYDEASEGRSLIHTGVGVLHTDDQDHRVRFRARPQVSEGPRILDTGILDADAYTTGNIEAAIVCGRCTVQSEAFTTSVSMLDGETLTTTGAYVHLSWFLTGENRVYERFGQHGPQFARNVPYQNFAWSRSHRGPGAWELKTRWSHLDFNPFDQGQYNDLTVGFNWYWSDRTRVMFDWIHPYTSSTAIYGSTESDLIGTRFDFNW